MASSDEFDDSIPEIVYQCISIIDEDSSKRDESCVKCPLCKQRGKIFYCIECVKNGNFLHSKKKSYERFADKKIANYRIEAEKAAVLQKFENAFSKKKQIENLKLEIYKSKEKIQLLKAGIQSCKGTISNDVKTIEDIKYRNSASQANHSVFNEKLFKLRRRQKKKASELDFEMKKLSSAHCALQSIIQCRTKELIQHIFPITEASPYHRNNSSSGDRFADLEEAQKTTYIQGQWVVATNVSDDFQYSVVEPCIPNSGDYSAYTTWCTEHIQGISRDSLTSYDKCQFDRAFGISAALAYTAQLVSILAFYMNAHLPKRTSFSDFCGHESSKAKFLHKVAKLNSNIVSLCLYREVDVTKINAQRTIENLLLLLKSEKEEVLCLTSDEEMQDLMESIEESLFKDMLPIDDSDSDEMESEFVHVSEEEISPVPDESLPETPPQPSLVSSVFSLFRAATGYS